MSVEANRTLVPAQHSERRQIGPRPGFKHEPYPVEVLGSEVIGREKHGPITVVYTRGERTNADNLGVGLSGRIESSFIHTNHPDQPSGLVTSQPVVETPRPAPVRRRQGW